MPCRPFRRPALYLLARDTFPMPKCRSRNTCREKECNPECGFAVWKEMLRLLKNPHFQKLSYLCDQFSVSLAKRFAIFLYPIYNHPVGLVHRVHVKRGEVDSRDLFRSMSQAVADDCERHFLALG